jgi:hypothetical protein
MSCELYGDIDERDQEVLSIRISIETHSNAYCGAGIRPMRAPRVVA